jgi:hypothetical protein
MVMKNMKRTQNQLVLMEKLQIEIRRTDSQRPYEEVRQPIPADGVEGERNG